MYMDEKIQRLFNLFEKREIIKKYVCRCGCCASKLF